MPLPFVVPKTYGKNHTIEDKDTGIKLEIPKYGSLTWAEFMFWVDAERSLGKEGVEKSMSAYRGEIVSGLLRLRFNIAPEISDADILKTPEGESLPESTVMAILDFFTNEQIRWKPLPAVEDTEKKEPAEK